MMKQTTLQLERWKKVVGFPNYSVSDRGRAKNNKTGYIFKPRTSGSRRGYPQVYLRNNGAKSKRFIHRLVLGAFVGPCPPKHETNHKDGNRDNNRLSNLEWVTSSENQRHAYRFGLTPVPCTKNENNGMCKLSNAEVKQLREMRFLFGVPVRNLSPLFGIGLKHVDRIIRFESRKGI